MLATTSGEEFCVRLTELLQILRVYKCNGNCTENQTVLIAEPCGYVDMFELFVSIDGYLCGRIRTFPPVIHRRRRVIHTYPQSYPRTYPRKLVSGGWEKMVNVAGNSHFVNEITLPL